MIYISLKPKLITITLLQKKNSTYVSTNISKIIPLTNNEIAQGKICNPSHIQKEIKLFLNENKIKKEKALLNIEYLSSDEKIWPYQVMQVILIISKTKLQIYKIISEGIKENLPINVSYLNAYKDFFTPFKPSKSTSPHQWLLVLIATSITYIGIGIAIQHNKNNKLNLLKSSIESKANENKNLQTKKLKLQKLISDNKKLKEEKALLIKIKTNKEIKPKLEALKIITEAIPPQICLSYLNINSNKPIDKKNNNLNKTLEIEGFTNKTSQILTFASNLKSSTLLKQTQITNLGETANLPEEKRGKTTKFYKFKIRSLFS